MQNKKILVVDDQPGIRLLIELAFIQDGICVLQAADAKQAFSLICQEQPDLVLLDLNMPDLKGTELLIQLRQLGISVKVIVITADEQPDLALFGTNFQIQACFTKPFDIHSLRSEVIKQLAS